MVEIVPEAEFTTRGCSVSRLLDSLARIPVLLSDEEAPLVSKWGKHPTKRYGQYPTKHAPTHVKLGTLTRCEFMPGRDRPNNL